MGTAHSGNNATPPSFLLPPGQLAAPFWACFLYPQDLCPHITEASSDFDAEKQVLPLAPFPNVCPAQAGAHHPAHSAPNPHVPLLGPFSRQQPLYRKVTETARSFVPSWCRWAGGHGDNGGRRWTGAQFPCLFCGALVQGSLLADKKQKVDPRTNGVGEERRENKEERNHSAALGGKASQCKELASAK